MAPAASNPVRRARSCCSGGSFDARIPMERRVISMVTNGIELIVTTEHNNAVDFAPIIASLGYGPDLLGSIVGDEFNFKNGHGGAYPVTFDPNSPGGGVPPERSITETSTSAELPAAWPKARATLN